MPTPNFVGVLLELGDPADLRLGEEDLQFGEAVEGPVLDELDHETTASDGLAQHDSHRSEVHIGDALLRRPLHSLLLSGRSAAEADVGGQWDIELEGPLPESIVLLGDRDGGAVGPVV